MAGWQPQPLDGSNIAMSSVGVPGDTQPRVLQGGQEYTDANGNVTAPVVISKDGTSWKPTYTYAVSATAPYATPTDWIVIRGVAGKIIEIQRIELSGAATAATGCVWLLKKHTIANTGGTSTNPTPMTIDSGDGSPPANMVFLYSAAPTIDASATLWKTVRMDMAILPGAQAYATDRYTWDAATAGGKALTLRGVAQEFALNFNGAAVPSGGVFDVSITITVI